MRTPKWTWLLAGIVVFAAALAFAQSPTSTETGTVVSYAENALVVDMESGRQVFMISVDTLHPEPITAGSVVEVAYRHPIEGSDERVATEVKVIKAAESAEELPQTASSLPLVALGGLLALAAAAGLHLASRSAL